MQCLLLTHLRALRRKLANTYLAVDSGLEIVPVINKIDLPSADPDRVIEEIEDVIGIPAEDAPKISAKQGINIHAVLEKSYQTFLLRQAMSTHLSVR